MKRATLALVAAFAAIVATAETSRTATENWTRNRIGEATNATLKAAKEYADAHGGDVQSVNGKTGTVVLAAADVHALPDTYTPPVQPTDTNAVRDIVKPMISDHIPSAISNATTRIDADLTAYVTVTYDNWTPSHSPIPDNPQDGDVYYSDVDYWSEYGGWASAKYRFDIDEGGWIYTLPTLMSGDYANPDATELTFPDGTKTYRKRTITTKLATTNDIPTKAEQIGAETPAAVDAKIAAAGHMTQAEANQAYYPKAQGDAWSTYWDGDDVRVTVTNYDSVAHLPALYLEQRTNETAMATNLFRVVWREMAHWEKFLGSGWDWDGQWQGFKAWAAGIVAQIEEKADRAWGFFDSHTGQYAPDGYTSISSEHIMLCKGASYQKTVTTRGDIWVLTADEPYEPTGVSTNGGFQLKDGDGNVQFEIVKGDKVTVKAQANRVTVEDGTTLVVVYNVIAPEHPAGETCLALETAEWKKEDAADCPATVVWSGSSGNWVARITPKSGLATGRCFFKATYQRGGDTYINNKCAVGMSKIVLGGVTYNLGTATISGHTVLTLTPAN